MSRVDKVDSTYQERIRRMDLLEREWSLCRLHKMMVAYQTSEAIWQELRSSVLQFVSRALKLPKSLNLDAEVSGLQGSQVDLSNVTPNGAVVPKREYLLEYNLVLRAWTQVCREMTERRPDLLSRFRVTPNIRIKFSKEQSANEGRPLNTSLLHSDAWVEGPWGMNCFVPIAGDTDLNTLEFWETNKFQDEFLQMSPSYNDMSWVQKHYAPVTSLVPQQGLVHLSDYSLLHKTIMRQNCGARLSIDTTIHVGNHCLPVRSDEYLDSIPDIGHDTIVAITKSEKDTPIENSNAFQHYTSGSLRLVDLREGKR